MDDGLKQRVVGAVVLTAVAVIFLPVLFEREVHRQVDTRTLIPPAPSIVTSEIREAIRPQGLVAAKDPEEMYQPQESDRVDDRPVTSKLDPQGIPRAWVVQVASFKTEKPAKALRDKLLADGYTAFFRKRRTAKGEVVRVFVGPKIEKQRVLTIKQELDKALHIDTLVLRFRP